MPVQNNMWLFIVLSVFLGALIHWLWSKRHTSRSAAELTQHKAILSESIQTQKQLEEKQINLRIQLERLSLERDQALQKITELREDSERDELRFNQLADKILQEKTSRFDTESTAKMDLILKPLKERIIHFETQLQNSHKDTIAQNSSLRQEIRQIQELNQQMSTETKNLTRALKGDQKLQGNWGEIVLERVLEKSGLEKGREYYTQQSYTGPDGRRFQPDVLIKLPDDKSMIIDSKVSLVAYERMISAVDTAEIAQHKKEHIQSIRRHIKQLSSKEYHQLLESSPDFVLLFLPIETAFAHAIAEDRQLYADAFEQNIILVSPTTLLATLRTVDTLWSYDKQRKNSLEIATEAGRMYDKFQGLLKDLSDVETRIQQTRFAYDKAINKLSTGSGNLLGKAQKLKKLGAKARKNIDPKWLVSSEEE